jgi:hypothetical protein
MKVAVLIRVYDRIDDLKYNLRVISGTWKSNDYYVIVVSNGKSNGFEILPESLPLIDKLVIVQENAGHRKGNSQLLMEGSKYIPEDCLYTLILEADTWMYKDGIISGYIKQLSEDAGAVWASAGWYDKYYALATDFAIIKTGYIKGNPGIFDFELFPECHIANFLRDTGRKYIWIKENMPVHVPSYVKYRYPYVPNIKEGRFYVFPESKTVTHHTEFLKGGMEQKKRYFNILAGFDFFPEAKTGNRNWNRFKMRFWIGLSKCFLKRSWYSKKTYKEIKQALNP